MHPVLITAHEKHFTVQFDANRTKTFDYRRRGNGIEAAVLEIGLALTQRRHHEGANTQFTISNGGVEHHFASSSARTIREGLREKFAFRRTTLHTKHTAEHMNKVKAKAERAVSDDIYAKSYAAMVKKPVTSVTHEERKIGKSEVLGRAYGMSPATVAAPKTAAAQPAKPTTQQLQQHERQLLGSTKKKAGKR